MKFKIERSFSANVIFESSIAIEGYSYLVIYGKHVNGYYCYVPNWKWACEMTNADNVLYNREKLIECGASGKVAQSLAEAIQFIVKEKINEN